jgi:hypothetical protein
MRYYLPGGDGQAAKVIAFDRGVSILLVSPTLERDELLRIAANFRRVAFDETSPCLSPREEASV